MNTAMIDQRNSRSLDKKGRESIDIPKVEKVCMVRVQRENTVEEDE